MTTLLDHWNPPKKHKYSAKRAYRCLSCGASAEKDGCLSCRSETVQSFDSKAEAKRYDHLRMLAKTGAISGLELQPRFPLYTKGALLGHYVGDFQYVEPGQGVIVEDVKGMDTPLSKWKRKHLEAQTGITVRVLKK